MTFIDRNKTDNFFVTIMKLKKEKSDNKTKIF